MSCDSWIAIVTGLPGCGHPPRPGVAQACGDGKKTRVLWGHLLQKAGPPTETQFLKGKSKTAVTDQGSRMSPAPSNTGQGHRGKLMPLPELQFFFLCNRGDLSNLTGWLRGKVKQTQRCQPTFGIQSMYVSCLPAWDGSPRGALPGRAALSARVGGPRRAAS